MQRTEPTYDPVMDAGFGVRGNSPKFLILRDEMPRFPKSESLAFLGDMNGLEKTRSSLIF